MESSRAIQCDATQPNAILYGTMQMQCGPAKNMRLYVLIRCCGRHAMLLVLTLRVLYVWACLCLYQILVCICLDWTGMLLCACRLPGTWYMYNVFVYVCIRGSGTAFAASAPLRAICIDVCIGLGVYLSNTTTVYCYGRLSDCLSVCRIELSDAW